jgi:soluble lytic murein transglycosylase
LVLLFGCTADPELATEDTPTPAAAAPETEVTPASTATPVPGTALTPVAGAPADLSTARQLEIEGDLQGAANAYVAIAARNTASRSEATINAARLLLELERPEDVRLLLEPFVANLAPADGPARYLLARSYAALSRWQESVGQYDLYIQSSRAALPYAYLDRARGLLELNQPVAAAQSAQTGLEIGVPGSMRRTYRLFIAQAYERAGSFSEAIRWYNLFSEGSGLDGDDALALQRIAAIKRDLGDPTYATELRALLSGFPGTTQAMTELQASLTRGEAVDPTVKGLIYYRHHDYPQAEPAFREQISVAANALAHYYLAAILESKDDSEGAMMHYGRVVALDPASGVADDALWWHARILETQDRLTEAAPLFARIVSQYPSSAWAPDAAFRHGMLSYRAERYGEAGQIWAQSAGILPAGSNRQRLQLWQAKSLIKAGDRNGARPILDLLARENEDDYYGVRALQLIDNKHDLPQAERESNVNLNPNFDWAGAEAWLAQRTGRTVVAGDWLSDQRWLRAQELWLIGRSAQGDAEAFDLMESYANDAIAMYTLSRTLQGQGRIGMSARAGQRLLRVLNTNPNQGLPKALLSLSYPPAFGASVQRHAEANRISPLLMLAFIRQESFFDPLAQSGAGALGLTQVLPSTGQTIAGRLGISDFTAERLFQADLNLRLGASYMADQLRNFNNEFFVAFTAYNAGPNAANRWRRAGGKDADVFLETVEYSESRLYVELVSENYAIYRYLYGGEPVPNLPD